MRHKQVHKLQGLLIKHLGEPFVDSARKSLDEKGECAKEVKRRLIENYRTAPDPCYGTININELIADVEREHRIFGTADV